jgi:hypothetical protein
MANLRDQDFGLSSLVQSRGIRYGEREHYILPCRLSLFVFEFFPVPPPSSNVFLDRSGVALNCAV